MCFLRASWDNLPWGPSWDFLEAFWGIQQEAGASKVHKRFQLFLQRGRNHTNGEQQGEWLSSRICAIVCLVFFWVMDVEHLWFVFWDPSCFCPILSHLGEILGHLGGMFRPRVFVEQQQAKRIRLSTAHTWWVQHRCLQFLSSGVGPRRTAQNWSWVCATFHQQLDFLAILWTRTWHKNVSHSTYSSLWSCHCYISQMLR